MGSEEVNHIYWNFVNVLTRENKAVTNLFYYEDKCIGFCVLLTDRISKSETKVFLDGEFPTFYPAVQLYCLGVDKESQSMGMGSIILNWTIAKVDELRENIGATFLVLEAYNDEELIKFYTKNELVEWKYLEKPSEDLVPMVYDYRGLDGDI